jgi:potassium/hydrogen antiporter
VLFFDETHISKSLRRQMRQGRYTVTFDRDFEGVIKAPSWAKLTLVIRDEHTLTPEEAGEVREGDYVYFLAPPEKAQLLDRFFVDMPAPAVPDARLVEDFFVSGDIALGALAEIYGLAVAPEDGEITLADHFRAGFGRPPREGDVLPLGSIVLVAHTVVDNRVTLVGLQLPEPETDATTLKGRFNALAARLRAALRP